MLTTLVRDWGTMMIPGPLPGLAPGLRPGLRPCAGRGAAIDGLPLAASAGCGARTYGACACGACACAAGGGWPCRARLASTSSNAAFFLRKPSRIWRAQPERRSMREHVRREGHCAEYVSRVHWRGTRRGNANKACECLG
eukprot:6184410-Pleurochrysis_carterae.AAC.5